MSRMGSGLAVLALALAVFGGGGGAHAQEAEPISPPSPTSTTTPPPLRTPDPEVPNSVTIRQPVSDLVALDLGEGLSVAPMTTGDSQSPIDSVWPDWEGLVGFAIPAAIPLLAALLIALVARHPRSAVARARDEAAELP